MEDVPKGASVLVVDDNPAVLEVVTELLKADGLDVTSAPDGNRAKQLLAEKDFHVLLADLRMSPVSGWEVIREAKEEYDLEVIVMTGFASLDNSIEALHQRVYDFLPKPVETDRLKRAVRNAANQAILRRRNKSLLQELEAKNQALEVEVARVTAELEELAVKDELTGVYNYRYLRDLLSNEVTRSLRYDHTVILAMLDLDFFKDLNDNHGHTVGNEVLKRVAVLFQASLRKSDTVCRYGGEEFAIVFPETTKKQAEPILQRTCDSLKEERIPIDDERVLTVSAGLAATPDDADSADDLIRLADEALYSAKAKGRDCLVLASTTPFE